MAIAKAGPLVSEIRGSVGGVVFRSVKGAQILSVRMKPIEKTSVHLKAVQDLVAIASQGWRALSDAGRQAWVNLAAWMDKPGGGRTQR